MKKLLVIILIVMPGLASGCCPTLLSTESPISPLPAATSPLPTEFTFPVDDLVFSISESLFQGDTEVSGTGPHGIPIVIVDITLMGEALGRGKIDPDGHFTIFVEPPLIVNHRIGIMLDAYATDIEYTEELLAYLVDFQGDNAIAVPQVGMMYDAASVLP